MSVLTVTTETESTQRVAAVKHPKRKATKKISGSNKSTKTTAATRSKIKKENDDEIDGNESNHHLRSDHQDTTASQSNINKISSQKNKKKNGEKKTAKKKNKESSKKRHPSKRHGESSTVASLANDNHNADKRVSFNNVQVYQFEYTIGDSITSKGPPIGLSSKAIKVEVFSVDAFELMRPTEEVDDYLKPEKRTQILIERGYTEDEIKEATYKTAVIRVQRKESIINMKWDDWAERKEMISRKVKKLTHPNVLFTKRTPFRYQREIMV